MAITGNVSREIEAECPQHVVIIPHSRPSLSATMLIVSLHDFWSVHALYNAAATLAIEKVPSNETNEMAPTGLLGVAHQARSFDDGPTNLELLGVCVAGICVLLIMVFICQRCIARLRAKKYWKSASSNVRAQATAGSPLQPTFPFHNKTVSAPSRSNTTIATTAAAMAEPSPVYDALRAGRPPSYRTSILMWREATARETEPEVAVWRP